ncbi:hypothetical protein Trydic_g2056 [Trypoxylus dichotomus]
MLLEFTLRRISSNKILRKIVWIMKRRRELLTEIHQQVSAHLNREYNKTSTVVANGAESLKEKTPLTHRGSFLDAKATFSPSLHRSFYRALEDICVRPVPSATVILADTDVKRSMVGERRRRKGWRESREQGI